MQHVPGFLIVSHGCRGVYVVVAGASQWCVPAIDSCCSITQQVCRRPLCPMWTNRYLVGWCQWVSFNMNLTFLESLRQCSIIENFITFKARYQIALMYKKCSPRHLGHAFWDHAQLEKVFQCQGIKAPCPLLLNIDVHDIPPSVHAFGLAKLLVASKSFNPFEHSCLCRQGFGRCTTKSWESARDSKRINPCPSLW